MKKTIFFLFSAVLLAACNQQPLTQQAPGEQELLDPVEHIEKDDRYYWDGSLEGLGAFEIVGENGEILFADRATSDDEEFRNLGLEAAKQNESLRLYIQEYLQTARNVRWEYEPALKILAAAHPDLEAVIGDYNGGSDYYNFNKENHIKTKNGLIFYATQGAHPEDPASVISKIGTQLLLFAKDKGVDGWWNESSEGHAPAFSLMRELMAGLLARAKTQEDVYRIGGVIQELLAEVDLVNLADDYSNLPSDIQSVLKVLRQPVR